MIFNVLDKSIHTFGMALGARVIPIFCETECACGFPILPCNEEFGNPILEKQTALRVNDFGAFRDERRNP